MFVTSFAHIIDRSNRWRSTARSNTRCRSTRRRRRRRTEPPIDSLRLLLRSLIDVFAFWLPGSYVIVDLVHYKDSYPWPKGLLRSLVVVSLRLADRALCPVSRLRCCRSRRRPRRVVVSMREDAARRRCNKVQFIHSFVHTFVVRGCVALTFCVELWRKLEHVDAVHAHDARCDERDDDSQGANCQYSCFIVFCFFVL